MSIEDVLMYIQILLNIGTLEVLQYILMSEMKCTLFALLYGLSKWHKNITAKS